MNKMLNLTITRRCIFIFQRACPVAQIGGGLAQKYEQNISSN